MQDAERAWPTMQDAALAVGYDLCQSCRQWYPPYRLKQFAFTGQPPFLLCDPCVVLIDAQRCLPKDEEPR